MMGLTFFSKLDWGSYIISIAKTTCKKVRELILLRLLSIFLYLPYAHAWNTTVTSALVLLVATWNC